MSSVFEQQKKKTFIFYFTKSEFFCNSDNVDLTDLAFLCLV